MYRSIWYRGRIRVEVYISYTCRLVGTTGERFRLLFVEAVVLALALALGLDFG